MGLLKPHILSAKKRRKKNKYWFFEGYDHGELALGGGPYSPPTTTNARNFIYDGVGWHEVSVTAWDNEVGFTINPTQEVSVPSYGTQVDTLLGSDALFYSVTVADWGGGVYGIEVGGATAESNVFQTTQESVSGVDYDLRWNIDTLQVYVNPV